MTSHLVQDWATQMLLAGGRPDDAVWNVIHIGFEQGLCDNAALLDELFNLPVDSGGPTLRTLAGPCYQQKTQSYIEIDASLAKILDRPAQAFRLTTAEVFIKEPGKAINGKPHGRWLTVPHLTEMILGVM